jgi:chaperonin GroES
MAKKEAKKINKFGLKPLGDRLVLEEVKEREKSHSGIYIPETVKDDKGSKMARVIAVGDGRFEDGKLIPMNVKVGDTVLFQWGDQIKFEGTEYFIVRESEIIAIIK